MLAILQKQKVFFASRTLLKQHDNDEKKTIMTTAITPTITTPTTPTPTILSKIIRERIYTRVKIIIDIKLLII